MTVNPRRPAFRLPWTDDGANESANAEVSAPASSDAADPVDGETAPVDEASQPTEASSAVADEAPASDEFLQNLVGAMRGVAEESRDAALADLRGNVEVRIEQLRAAAAERAEELRRGSEFDIVATGDWEKSEIDRVKAEAERRVTAHRAELDRQLADHRSASEREIDVTRRRLADYERDLTVFFTELAEIRDPAEFVAAAKRMPRGPELLTTAPASQASPAAAEPAVSEPEADGDSPAADSSAADVATQPETEAAVDEASQPTEAAAPEVAPTDQTSDDATGEVATAQGGEQNGNPDAATAEAEHIAEPAPNEEAVDARLAKRLAELDRRLSNGESSKPAPGTETEPERAADTESMSAPDSTDSTDSTHSTDSTDSTESAEPEALTATEGATEESNGEVSTPIMVKGLGSFGAITSFKQALERADGIQGVTLSLGPGGEFVYRANHAPGFDLVAAIRGIEGQAVTIDDTDGSLMVTIQRGR